MMHSLLVIIKSAKTKTITKKVHYGSCLTLTYLGTETSGTLHIFQCQGAWYGDYNKLIDEAIARALIILKVAKIMGI